MFLGTSGQLYYTSGELLCEEQGLLCVYEYCDQQIVCIYCGLPPETEE